MWIRDHATRSKLRVDSQSAAADGCTTIIPTSKIFPIFGKIIRRYIIRCGRKKRQVITFSSSNYHGQKTTAKNCSSGSTIANEGMASASRKLHPKWISRSLIANYNNLYHFYYGVAKDFGRIGCRQSARKYVTMKRNLSLSPISAKSLKSGEFDLFQNFNKVWSTSIARRRHRTT